VKEGVDRVPPRTVPTAEAKSAAFQLLNHAQIAAAGALILDVVLYGIFLLSINPTNVGYSVMVVFQNGGLVGAFLLAWAFPAVTLWGAHRVQQLGRADHWWEARRWLPPFIVLGFISWIVGGYYLLEARNLIDSWTGTGRNSPTARSVP
jgi:hypothetical protein